MQFSRNFLIGLFVCLAPGANAATITSFNPSEGKTIIGLTGPIMPGDSNRLHLMIQTANASGRVVTRVRLNSPGGNLTEGVKLAELIRFGKIDSVVPNGSICASACFIVFSAGAAKFAAYSASIGVHGASEKGQETLTSRAATAAMGRIVKELGVPNEIIVRMIVTPPNQIVWLPMNTLRAMGTTISINEP